MGNSSSIESVILEGDVSGLKELLQGQSKSKKDTVEETSGSPNNNNAETDLGLALCLAASLQDHPMQKLQCIIQLLIQADADLNRADENGWTCLHHACSAGNLDLLPFLVDHSALPTRDLLGFLPQDVCTKVPASDGILQTLNDAFDFDGFSIETTSDGLGHELGIPLVVRVCTPENCTRDGYIQLVYHQDGESMVSVPQYGEYVRLCMKSEERDDPLNTERSIKFDTSKLPDGCTCHVLYVCSDINMLARNVVASTGPILVKSGVAKYTFMVAGVVFHHMSKSLEGKVFETADDFKRFMRQTNDTLGSPPQRDGEQQQQQQQQQQQDKRFCMEKLPVIAEDGEPDHPEAE